MLHYAGEALHLGIVADAASSHGTSAADAVPRSELASALRSIEARLAALEPMNTAPPVGAGIFLTNSVTKPVHWGLVGAPRTLFG